MKKFLTSLAVVLAALAGYQAEKIDLLNPVHRYGIVSDSPLPVIVGAKVNSGNENGRYASMELTEEQADSLRDHLPAGSILAKERLYHTQMGCKPAPDQDPNRPKPPTPPQDAEVTPWGVKRVGAYKLNTGQRGESVLVCVVDTGIDTDHPDLVGIIAGGKSYVGSSYEDDNGHGTHVAGTIAAKLNKIGVRGVTGARIFAVKALAANGSGWSIAIANGIDECFRRNSNIINLSLGSPASAGEDPIIASAIRNALNRGVTVVAAAGNDSGPVGYPAASNGVIAVSSSNESDRLSYFSSRGPQIDYIGPGSNILSTCMGGGYCEMSGTSMAAPHVSGLLALEKAGRALRLEQLALSPSEQGKGMLVVK